ncbi:hypothetical protein FRB90_002808 [Tulasnella sp. 427]|nr:hypothetical protein FRB90_002808 [Tulasnella sp. 427]
MIDPAPSEHGDVHAAVPVTPSARLKARLEQLEEWRVEPMQISFLQGDDARKFFGGHATVTKAVKEDYFVDFKEGEVEVENSCKPIQGRAERPEEAATDSDKHVSAGWTLISKSKIVSKGPTQESAVIEHIISGGCGKAAQDRR